MADCMYHGYTGSPGPCLECEREEERRPKDCYLCRDTGRRGETYCGGCDTGRKMAKTAGRLCYDPYSHEWIFP